jgi:hypothetical protein
VTHLYTLHDHQVKAVEHLHKNPRAGLFLPVGAGKTLSVLAATTPEHLPMLVVAPKQVAEHVWPAETARWRPDLTIALAAGTPAKRAAAFAREADITVVSRDNLADALKYPKRFATIVLDESQSFKSRSSARWKAARKLTKDAAHVWVLTGTPAGNGLLDLWAQVYLIDNGERLYPQITRFRQRYFYPEKVLPNGVVAKWGIKPGAEEAIYKVLGDVCLHIPLDGLDLPEITYNTVPVGLPPPVQRMYDTLKKDGVVSLELLGGDVYAAPTAATLSNRLTQVTAGIFYSENGDGSYEGLHVEKLRALSEIVETTEGGVLVFYRYRAEMERILQLLPQARKVTDKGAIDAWNARELPVMVAHPASAGHGLNLQFGGSVIAWCSLPWSLEEWIQANGRLHRQGQENRVMVHMLTVPDSIDGNIFDVLQGKRTVQQALLDALTR